jgi:hypothetical protein
MKRTTLPALPSEARALTAASVATLTAADAANMSGPVLVATFNALTGENVKRFATPADGRKRLLAALQKARGAAPKAGVDGVVKNQRDLMKTPKETAALQRATAKDKRLATLNGEKAPPAAKTVVGKAKFLRTAKITLLRKDNPARPGTGHHIRYNLYRDGMTVGEFYDVGGHGTDVRWDAERHYIAVN